MSDITPSSNERLLEALRQRERLLEANLAELRARLDEVREMVTLLAVRPRGRPRGVRSIEPAPVPQPELMPDDPEAA